MEILIGILLAVLSWIFGYMYARYSLQEFKDELIAHAEDLVAIEKKLKKEVQDIREEYYGILRKIGRPHKDDKHM